ncbi:MAG: carboxypeptidase-like regulatory domain-containing protein, partial [Acidobacteria bacterium]|nr:carboxypeptidase-like regulatory domain-containing protein [Acidobacteriota bacterium]
MQHLNSTAAPVWLLLGALAAPAPAAAQDAAVSGTVTDTTGFVLPGVTVEARDAAGDRVETAVSDGAGAFTLALPPGTYEVTFTLPGFQDAVRDAVEVGAGATVTLDVELAVELEERVVVVGSRAQPRSVTESQVPIDAIPFQDVASQGMTTLDYQLR